METSRIQASLEELEVVSNKLIEKSRSCPVIAFRGELGAGKTTLIKNMCNLLDVKDEVSSPTFSIINEYRDEDGKSVYHFDFYRIEEEEEALDIGCEDYFYSGNLCLIEWPSMVENLLPQERIEVNISIKQGKREFLIKDLY